MNVWGQGGSSGQTVIDLTMTGNLTFDTQNQRIIGDLTSTPPHLRLMFQTKVVNGLSDLGIIPHGTSDVSGFTAYNSANPDAANQTYMRSVGSNGVFGASQILILQTQFTNRLIIDTTGLISIGNFLILHANPTNPMHAATKLYADSLVAGGPFLPIAGGTLTGALTLSGAPTVNLHAATKLYVDQGDTAANTNANNRVLKAGDTMTGPLFLSGAPTLNLHAATKLYVDTVVAGGGLPVTGGTLTGNLNFSGQALRITGDLTSLPITNRLLFKTDVVDGISVMGVIPNGTATKAAFAAYSKTDPDNSSYIEMSATDALSCAIFSGQNGTGAYLPMYFVTGGTSAFRINTAGDVELIRDGAKLRGRFGGVGALRNSIQTHLINDDTLLPILPNGTSSRSGLVVHNASNEANSAYGLFSITSTEVNIFAGFQGTGVALPFKIFVNSGTPSMWMATDGKVGVGNFAPDHDFDVRKDQNANTILAVHNATAGAGAKAAVYVLSDVVQMQMGATSSASGASGTFGTDSAHPLLISTNGITRATILVDGKFGLRLTPLAPFHMLGTFVGAPLTAGSGADPSTTHRIENGALVLDTGIYANGNVWVQARNGGNFASNFSYILQPNGGFVGIGPNTLPQPAAALHVSRPVPGGAPVTVGVSDPNQIFVLGNGSIQLRTGLFGSGDIWMQGSWANDYSLFANLRLNPVGASVVLAGSSGSTVVPGTDASVNFGTGVARWLNVFTVNAPVVGSDARGKTPIAILSTDEVEAAKVLAREIGSYKRLASMVRKGEEAARTHIGVTVQRVIEVLESYSLNPLSYSFICYDEWDADEEQGIVAGNGYGLRYDEFAMFLAAGFEARLAALEVSSTVH